MRYISILYLFVVIGIDTFSYIFGQTLDTVILNTTIVHSFLDRGRTFSPSLRLFITAVNMFDIFIYQEPSYFQHFIL
jgi:hypothetical protein